MSKMIKRVEIKNGGLLKNNFYLEDFCGFIDEIRGRLDKLEDFLVKEGFHKGSIEFEFDSCDYDGVYGVKIYAKRDETEKERDKRISEEKKKKAAIQKRKETIRKKELQILEKLAKKHGKALK